MDASGCLTQRVSARRLSYRRSRLVARRAVQEVDEGQARADERIALESVDIVPLPSPLQSPVVEKSAVVPLAGKVDLESFVSLEKTSEDEKTKGLFSLDKTQSLWLLNMVSLAYGSNTTFVKDTIEGSHLEPSVICAMRYGVATALVMPALLGPGLRNISWNLSFELGFALFCGYQSQSQQLLTETASQGSIMLAIFILLVPVVELAFGRKFTQKKFVSLVVALLGISLLAIGGGGEDETAVAVKTIMGIPEGSLWGLASAVAFAVHLVRSEMRQYEAKDVGQLAAGQLAVCGFLSLGLLGVQAATDPAIASQLNPAVIASQMPWTPFFVSSIVGTVLGQCGELIAVGKVPASQASLTLSLVTVWGLMFGAIFNHDRLTPLSWAGAAIIIGATIVPKALDVIADRKQQATEASGGDSPKPDAPPMSMTSEEFVRTTVSATMLAATPAMTDAGMLATGRAVVTRAMTTALSAEGSSLLAGAGGAVEAGAAGATAAAEAAAATGATGAVQSGVARAAGAAGASIASGAMEAAGAAAGAAGAAASAASSLAAGGGAATGAAATGAAVTGAAASGAAATGAATGGAAATSAAIAGAATTAAAAAGTAATGAAAGTTAATAAATGAAAATSAAAAGAGAAATGSTAAGLAVAGGAAAAAAAAVASGAVSGDDVTNVITNASGVLSSGADALNAAGSSSITDATQAVIDGVRSVGTAMAESPVDPTALAQGGADISDAATRALEAIDSTPANESVEQAVQAAKEAFAGKVKAD